ncbi:MAG: hypothetical protein VX278_00805 [Myxococcota bacterium]|nr:hypothetical protein [Myxococcota bacterium]
MIVLLTGLLFAQESTQKTESALGVQHHFNFRMGYSTATSNGRPTICVEGLVLSLFAVEACGTGHGFVHRESGTDFVHFRGKWNAFSREFTRSKLHGQLGVGFAEIQIADDDLGFAFGGTGTGVETAGPEISSSLQWIRGLGPYTEIILDMNAGAAFFYYGPELVVPQNQFFPFFELSVGLGW